jgi:primary-amine oxidase
MKAVRSMIANESVASINWEENDAINYAIVNKDSPNRFGELPGYRMKRSKCLSTIPLLLILLSPSQTIK